MPRNRDLENQWLAATGEDPNAPGAAAPPSWLNARRHERARKSVRRRVQKALHLLVDIEKKLAAQGLAFSPPHDSLKKVIEELNTFLDCYDKKTKG